ncbi:MAG: TRAP-type mannitol/chloroaromatic compound transport system substrate-binding protein, partial [Flavobacteriales bacterium]
MLKTYTAEKNTTKKRTFSKFGLSKIASALLVTLVFTSADSMAAQRWKLHSAYGSNVPVVGSAAGDIALSITQFSGGELKVKAFEPRALVSGSSYYDAVSKGAIT